MYVLIQVLQSRERPAVRILRIEDFEGSSSGREVSGDCRSRRVFVAAVAAAAGAREGAAHARGAPMPSRSASVATH